MRSMVTCITGDAGSDSLARAGNAWRAVRRAGNEAASRGTMPCAARVVSRTGSAGSSVGAARRRGMKSCVSRPDSTCFAAGRAASVGCGSAGMAAESAASTLSECIGVALRTDDGSVVRASLPGFGACRAIVALCATGSRAGAMGSATPVASGKPVAGARSGARVTAAGCTLPWGASTRWLSLENRPPIRLAPSRGRAVGGRGSRRGSGLRSSHRHARVHPPAPAARAR